MSGQVALVSGGASGLGLASVEAIHEQGARVLVLDLPDSAGEEVAHRLGADVRFLAGDVTQPDDVAAACAAAADWGPLRALVHTAGAGGPLRVVDRDGEPASQETFDRIIRLNVSGTFNVLRHTAATMARLDPLDSERGVCVLTSSIAAFEGRIGQVPYAAAKAAIVGLTLPAARDLASRLIRVCTIAPGTFDTPLLARLKAEVRDELANEIPHPRRLGAAKEFGMLARQIIENAMLNGETVRLDGALRMKP